MLLFYVLGASWPISFWVWLVFRHHLLKWSICLLFLFKELPLQRWLSLQAASPIGPLDDCLITCLWVPKTVLLIDLACCWNCAEYSTHLTFVLFSGIPMGRPPKTVGPTCSQKQVDYRPILQTSASKHGRLDGWPMSTPEEVVGLLFSWDEPESLRGR